MQTVTITIGRNVPLRNYEAAGRVDMLEPGTRSLNADAWRAFTARVASALVEFESDVAGLESTWVETHDGVGEWEGEAEQSRKVTLYYHAAPLGVLPAQRQSLEERLTSIRERYFQDAVSVVWGDSTLI